jgi:hypothetical protein
MHMVEEALHIEQRFTCFKAIFERDVHLGWIHIAQPHYFIIVWLVSWVGYVREDYLIGFLRNKDVYR